MAQEAIYRMRHQDYLMPLFY